ncbi:MAG: hypothetical protein OZSIB_0018 [Candidatus Ozemobacter sibiricus]|jgi:hypothetical protein|uniref:Uncharacterized protein n=1 Tax=Candidatus Ozemobacter sibiricus TaxID=2268124 RepID=A0A367ZMM7_9BACT|nr:MAG: hypothetical protein OZSIB_0018 [Candidatus Ozemobacter sibiricus]
MPLSDIDPLFFVLLVVSFGMAFGRLFFARFKAMADEGAAALGEAVRAAVRERAAEAASAHPGVAEEPDAAAFAVASPRSSFAAGRYAVICGVIGLFVFCLHEGISLDRLVRERWRPAAGPAAVAVPRGEDWAIIDGVRWFRLVGTDSAGVGYQGWVSELAFNQAPPEPSGDGDLLQKIGLPSIRERVEAARRLRQAGEALKQALEQR